MALTLHYASGSPYAWRVWLALEIKGIPYEHKLLSFDAGDLKRPEFTALNPRQRVPVIVDDGFALYESAAILEYLEDKWPKPPLLSADLRRRAVQRRMMREADQYLAPAADALIDAVLFPPSGGVTEEELAAAGGAVRTELARWEVAGDYLAGDLSMVDVTVYPQLALLERVARRKPGPATADLVGPKMQAWARRMEALPAVQATRPPHWKAA
jgi:glutathione S-transferase